MEKNNNKNNDKLWRGVHIALTITAIIAPVAVAYGIFGERVNNNTRNIEKNSICIKILETTTNEQCLSIGKVEKDVQYIREIVDEIKREIKKDVARRNPE